MRKIIILLSVIENVYSVLSNKSLFKNKPEKEIVEENFSFGILRYIYNILHNYKGNQGMMQIMV
jgi:hypothetical protein